MRKIDAVASGLPPPSPFTCCRQRFYEAQGSLARGGFGCHEGIKEHFLQLMASLAGLDGHPWQFNSLVYSEEFGDISK